MDLLEDNKNKLVRCNRFYLDLKNSKKQDVVALTEDNKNKLVRCNRFYLDLKNSKKQDVVALTQDLKQIIDAEIEPFLSKDINYVVTDRPNWKPESKGVENWAPDTPSSTPSPCTFTKWEFGDGDSPCNETEHKRNRLQTSRGLKLLEQSTMYHKREGSTDVLENSRYWGICILPIAMVRKWLDKNKTSIAKTVEKKVLHQSQKSNDQHVMGVKKLISPFIKVEDRKKYHRTFYKEFSVWPDISGMCNTHIQYESNNVQGPNLDANKQQPHHVTAEGFAAKARDMVKNTSLKQEAEKKRKSYCEICSAAYSSLQQHLVTKYHRTFLSDKTNYLYLNEVIATLPPVDKFLTREHLVSTFKNSSFSKMKKIKSNEIPPVPSEARKVTARRRCIATNLVHKFELCSITSHSITSAKAVDEEENLYHSLEEERIEASCDSPLYCGFSFLEGNHAVDSTTVKQSIFPVSLVTPSGVDTPISLPLDEENDANKGDTSIIFDSVQNICDDHEVVPEVPVPVPETSALNAVPVSNSLLCAYDDSVVDTVEAYGQLAEYTPACSGVTATGDKMSKQDNLSMDGSVQTLECDNKKFPDVDDQTTKQDNISVDDSLQTAGWDCEMIPECSAPTGMSVPVVNEGTITRLDNIPIDYTLQATGCDCEMVPEISAAEMVTLESFENAVISSKMNVDMDVERPLVPEISAAEMAPLENAMISSIKNVDMDVERPLENHIQFNQNTLIILPDTQKGKVLPETLLPVPVNFNMSAAVPSSSLPLDRKDEENTHSISENIGQDLGESNVEYEAAYMCRNEKIVAGKREELLDITGGFNASAECVDTGIYEHFQFQPLNLCVRQSDAISNNEQIAINSPSVQKYSVTPSGKRVRSSSTQSRKVCILSDRSMLTIFNSDSDAPDFDGFKSDDKNKSSGLSYVEISEFSEELEDDELSFQYEVNLCRSSEVDEKWDVTLSEFIERKVSDKPQNCCTKYKTQPVEIQPIDLSSNSGDTGYTSGNKPPGIHVSEVT